MPDLRNEHAFPLALGDGFSQFGSGFAAVPFVVVRVHGDEDLDSRDEVLPMDLHGQHPFDARESELDGIVDKTGFTGEAAHKGADFFGVQQHGDTSSR